MGFQSNQSLEQKIIGFQHKYGLEPTGRKGDVKDKVQAEHDESFKTSGKLFADLAPPEDESSLDSDLALA